MNYYNNIAAGQIPSGLEDKTCCLKELVNFARKYKATVAVLVASARRDDFTNDITGWVEWAQANGFSGSELHHLRQIGDLLLDSKNIDEQLYSRLFVIDTEKLKSIQRLPRKDLVKFLKAYPPEKLTRDEIRAAVSTCLGETPKQKGKTPYQPDLWESLDALTQKDEKDFQAIAMREDFDESSAMKFAIGGIGMLTACSTYWKTHEADNAELLVAIEKQLRDNADALEEIRNKQVARLQAG